jgi:hypothetical protein
LEGIVNRMSIGPHAPFRYTGRALFRCMVSHLVHYDFITNLLLYNYLSHIITYDIGNKCRIGNLLIMIGPRNSASKKARKGKGMEFDGTLEPLLK